MLNNSGGRRAKGVVAMKKIACLFLCCLVCFSAGSCTKKEDSEKAVTQKEVSEVSEVPEVSEVAVVGKWEITEWRADHVDQIEMWRIGALSVEFRADGSIESHLVYANGDERSSKGTWKRSGDQLEITISGGGETEGDEPFERTREFAIDELTEGAFLVRGEIGSTEKPIVLTYKARRLPADEN
jgi:hypothetical protein